MKKLRIIVVIVIIIGIIGVIFGIRHLNNNKNNYEIEKIEKYSYFKLYEKEKYGVIDDKGNIIIEPIYEMLNIPNPSKDLFVCYSDYNDSTGEYKVKVLNSKNEQILTQYEQVLPLSCEDSLSNIPFEKSVLKYKENGKYGIIDFAGKKITKPIYDDIESLKFREGCLKVKQNDNYGIININGREIVKVEYSDIKSDEYYTKQNDYMDAGFIVQIKTDDGYRYGYINKNGKEVVKPQYNELNRIDDIEDEKNAYLLFSKNGKYGILENNKEIIKNNYEEIEYIKSNNIFIVQENSKQGVLAIDSKEILPTTFDYILCTGNKITAKRGDSIEIYNNKGERLESKYDNIIETQNENYMIVLDNNNKYGVINQNWQTLLANEYDNLEYAFDNYFIATKNGKVGVIDINKSEAIEYKYDIIQKIKEKNAFQAIVAKTNTIDIYNNKAELQTSLKDATIYTFDNYFKLILEKDMQYFDNNGNTVSNKNVIGIRKLYSYKKDGKWGFADNNDKVIVEPKYDLVTEMNKYGFAGIKLNNKWGVINDEGKVIVEPMYKIDFNDPEFIGKYCKLNFGYGFEYYSDEINK